MGPTDINILKCTETQRSVRKARCNQSVGGGTGGFLWDGWPEGGVHPRASVPVATGCWPSGTDGQINQVIEGSSRRDTHGGAG